MQFNSLLLGWQHLGNGLHRGSHGCGTGHGAHTGAHGAGHAGAHTGAHGAGHTGAQTGWHTGLHTGGHAGLQGGGHTGLHGSGQTAGHGCSQTGALLSQHRLSEEQPTNVIALRNRNEANIPKCFINDSFFSWLWFLVACFI